MDATTTPEKLPTGKQATLFKQEQEEHDKADALQIHNNRVDMLITPKGHQRLRTFGYQVIEVPGPLPPSTTDRRSL